MVAQRENEWRSPKHMLFLVVCLVVLICAMGYADDAQREEEVFPDFVSGDVVRGANRTWMNYVTRWNETRGTPLQGDTEIASSQWAEGLARFKPAYIYTHGVNIVIVRSCHDGNEEGFYVALAIASSPGANDEQFVRIPIAHHAGGTVCAFRRRGHFEREQANSDKSMEWLLDYIMEVEDREPAERSRRMARLQEFFAERREPDREIMQRQDLPGERLAETSTDMLFRHYMDKSYRAMMTVASTPSAAMIGVQRLLNSSSTIGELYMRPDMAEGIPKAYREYDLSPQSISDEEMVETLFRGFDEPERSRLLEQVGIEELKITRVSMSLRGADQLLLSPQFFPKLKGHEKAFLAVLLKRYDDIQKLQIDNGEDAYGAALSSTRPFCLRLAESLDRDLHDRLIAIQSQSPGKRGPFMEEIRRFLSQ